MKKILLLIMTLVFLVATFLPVLAAEEEAGAIVSGGSHTLDAGKAFLGNERWTKNAQSIVLYERTSGTLMYEWNCDEKTDPASLVKIMTALIVVEQGNLSDSVPASSEALNSISVGAASVRIKENEVLTVEQLLYCMLVSSANDAAAILAEHIGGSQSGFVAMMNARAEELGCTNTNFTNPTGLYDENQYSTARDIARILDAAMEHELFRTIFGTIQYTVPATNLSDPRRLTSGNFLMSTDEMKTYFDDRVIGGRTAVTAAGFRSLATVAEAKNMEMICILLGSASTIAEDGVSVEIFGGYQETSQVLTKVFQGLWLTQVIRQDQVLTQKSVVNGECDVILGPMDSEFAILSDSIRTDDLIYRFSEEEPIEAPIEKGDVVSSVEIWYNGICIAQTDLYAMNHVGTVQPQIVDTTGNDTNNASLFWTLLIVAGLVVVVILIVRFVRGIAKQNANNQRRQYRRNRRRSR